MGDLKGNPEGNRKGKLKGNLKGNLRKPEGKHPKETSRGNRARPAGEIREDQAKPTGRSKQAGDGLQPPGPLRGPKGKTFGGR